MPGPPPAVAAARVALRRALSDLDLGGVRPASPADPPGPDAPLVLVACSGGADSLALAATTAFVAPRLGLRSGAVVVDHGLQDDSAGVAETAARAARALFQTEHPCVEHDGFDPERAGRAAGAPVEVVRVAVTQTGEGPEAAARSARFTALAKVAGRLGAAAVLLGHTLDDQAEQVLLGMTRGSGARSLSGMAGVRPLLAGDVASSESARAAGTDAPVLAVRPFLSITRAQTVSVCTELGLVPWQDPHNQDGRYARVRARSALRMLEDSLGPGVPEALARTAALLRDDADLLDDLADTAHRDLGDGPWPVARLVELPVAVRTRLWRRSALDAGSPGTDLNAGHLLAVDALLTDWRGQGPIHLPGQVRAGRRQGWLWLEPGRASTMTP